MASNTKTKVVILDSNVWIAFFLTTDIFHYEAVRIIGNYEKRKYHFLIPAIILLELITVLTKNGLDINNTRKIITDIQSTDNYEIYSIEHQELVELALQNSTKNSLKSLDYAIFLHYVKMKIAKFESFDLKLLKSIHLYQKNHGKN